MDDKTMRTVDHCTLLDSNLFFVFFLPARFPSTVRIASSPVYFGFHPVAFNFALLRVKSIMYARIHDG